LLNENAVRNVNQLSGASYGNTWSIVLPRMLRRGTNWIF